MRLLKPFFITLSGLAIVLLAVSSLLPSRVMTSRWAMVHAPKDSVLHQVQDLRHWPEWNLLLNASTLTPIKETYAEGDSVHWTMPGEHRGDMVVESWNEKGISTRMSFDHQRPFRTGFSVEQRQADSVQVVWFLIEDLKWYPWEKFYGMMASDLKGPLMQQSLDRLKARLQQ